MISKLAFAALVALCCAPLVALQETAVPDLQTLQTMAARFAPTEIGADLSKLSDNDRRVLRLDPVGSKNDRVAVGGTDGQFAGRNQHIRMFAFGEAEPHSAIRFGCRFRHEL